MPVTISPRIVNINTIVTRAPVPSQLQQSGALVSVGGTGLTTGTYQFCGQLSDVEAILATSGSGNYAELAKMATTFFAQGTAVGCYVLELGYTASIDAQIASLFTWITANPGIFYAYLVPADWDYSKDEVGGGLITNPGSGYTTAPAVTFSTPSSGVTATGTAIIQNGQAVGITITNPGNGYTTAPTVTIAAPTIGVTATATAYLACAMNILAGSFASPTGMTYFFVTTSTANIVNYATLKSVFAVVEASTAPSSEFTAAMPFYQWLVNLPGASNQLAPMSYRYAYGVTSWANINNPAIQTILTAYGNTILTGAEGGISNACLFKGTTMDGEQAAWWYGIDWLQIQMKQAVAAAIINGSNTNPPLLYDQTGINTLKKVAQQVGNNGATFRCALSAVVSAIPFATYTSQNPNDYNAGIYNGLSCLAVGQNGFLAVQFTITASQLVV